METKVQNKNGKTIFTHEIKHFNFNRKMHWGKGRIITTGVIFLTGGKKIAIVGAKFILVGPNDVTEGIVLKSNPAYRRIKRMIAMQFKTFRIGSKAFLRERITTLRGAAVNGQHNCNLFRHSTISFLEHKSDFLRKAS